MYQVSLSRGQSTIDQLFIVRQIMAKAHAFDTPIFQMFINFEQAYDQIQRAAVYSAMEEMGIPIKFIALTRMLMLNSKTVVKIQQHTTTEFETGEGL